MSAAMIEAARDLAEAVESMQATFGCIQGKTPEDADLHIHEKWAEEFLAERLATLRTALAAAEAQPTELEAMVDKAWSRFEAEDQRLKVKKSERVHALVNAGHFPGMSEAFDAHMGAACWTDPAYAPDASTWAAAWRASKAQPVGEPVAWSGDPSTQDYASTKPSTPAGWMARSALQQAALALEELQGPGFLIGGVMHYRIGLILPKLNEAIDALAAPPVQPAAPLTDEQIKALVLATVYEGDAITPHRDAWAAEIGIPFARAVEREHGIGAGA